MRPAALLFALALMVGCGGGSAKQPAITLPPTSTSPPTECAGSEADASRTVVIRVDDVVGGYGSFGTRAPSGLTAGIVRVAVEADADNVSPVDVTLLLDGAEVFVFRGVPAGMTCGVDLDLLAGNYDVTSSDGSAGFTVEP